jgi:hypothetical protein
MAWYDPSRDATDETSKTGSRRLYRRLAFLITLLLCACFLMPPFLYALYARFLSVLPVLLTGAAVLVGSVCLLRRMKRLHDRYHAALALEAHARAHLRRRHAEALAPFLQALCQTYGRYDEYRDYLSDWLDEHQPFLARLAAFGRRVHPHWIDPATKPISVLADIAVDTAALAALPDKDVAAFLATLSAETRHGALCGILPTPDDLLAYLRTSEHEWRERLTRHQHDLDRRVRERIAEEASRKHMRVGH